jgi:DNA-binding MarR family transcriptional regulator
MHATPQTDPLHRMGSLATIDRLLRTSLPASLATLSQEIATQLGLTITQLNFLNLLQRAAMPLSPVNLAEFTGLAPSTITKVVQQLERNGFLGTVKGARDLRRCYLVMTSSYDESLTSLLQSMTIDIAIIGRLYHDHELKIVSNFLTDIIPVLDDETRRLRR